MENFLKSIAIPPSKGKVLQVQPGETHILKAVGADTNGAYTLDIEHIIAVSKKQGIEILLPPSEG